MLENELTQKGYGFISPEVYLKEVNVASLHDLKKIFDENLQEDGIPFRKRAYVKFKLNTKNMTLQLHSNQNYYQTAMSNQKDGGRIRKFKSLDTSLLNIPIIQNILQQNSQIISTLPNFSQQDSLNIGFHFIRYKANEELASYSSPAWLHKDDESLVFIHLINLSKTAVGGDNIIADNTKHITQVIRLEDELETLVLNQNVFHAVTPLGSKKGTAVRDIILFTIEPEHTQHMREKYHA